MADSTTKVGFQLASSLDSGHLTDAEYIKGGYFVVKTLAERDNMKVASGTDDGTIIEGSLCYCQEDKTFYHFNGSQWGPCWLGGGSTDGWIFSGGTAADILAQNATQLASTTLSSDY